MKALSALGLLLLTANFLSAQEPLPAPWKHQDIGAAQVPGTAEHAAGVFTLQGTMDIWGKADGCHVAWQPLHGDGQLVARVAAMANPGGVAHAKASLTIRQSLDPGSPSVTLCVTATDGTQFLYRAKADGETVRVNTETEAPKGSVPKGQFPCWLKLVRQGREFRGYESTDGQQWQLTGQITLDLPADTVVALAASSHKPDVLTKATLDHVQLTLQPTSTPATAPGSAPAASPAKKTSKGRGSQLVTIAIDGADKRLVYQTADNIQAPNWSPDGKWLVFNSNGRLFRIAPDGGSKPEQIPTGNLRSVNNDHMLSPDGQTIYLSADDGHLYAIPFAGGQPRRISNDQAAERKFKYYLHGVSPDGKTLAYTGAEVAGTDAWGRLDLFTIPAAGGPDTRLTNTPAPDDGPEYSSDGKWIYFNSELNAKEPGHAQCYRMKPDGTGIEQLTRDERVNWFPHVSPDLSWVVYISFPPGTIAHPANKDVILRRMKPDGAQQADIIRFNGGQGSINVNSWSPDNKHIGFVMYPEAE